jgi:hypothetical protein
MMQREQATGVIAELAEFADHRRRRQQHVRPDPVRPPVEFFDVEFDGYP